MLKTLECSSRGDRRFSALYAEVSFCKNWDTIENHYQNCKRDRYGNKAGKGRKVEYVLLKNKKFSPACLTDLYYALWFVYLSNHKELIPIINQYDVFTDMFRGHCKNCQADVIRKVRYEGLESLRIYYENIKKLYSQSK